MGQNGASPSRQTATTALLVLSQMPRGACPVPLQPLLAPRARPSPAPAHILGPNLPDQGHPSFGAGGTLKHRGISKTGPAVPRSPDLALQEDLRL